MNPALLVQFAPLIEALAAGLLRGMLSQLVAAPGAAVGGEPAAAAPSVAPAGIDLGGLVAALAPLLTQQLAGTLPNLIAAEVARLNPGAKS